MATPIDVVVFKCRKICPTGNRWNRALFISQKILMPPKLSLLRGHAPKSTRVSPQHLAHNVTDFIQIGSLSAELQPNAWRPFFCPIKYFHDLARIRPYSRRIIIVIIIIIISTIFFIVLLSWQSHWESLSGSFDECRGGRLPRGWIQANWHEMWFCYCLHPQSLFIITTQPLHSDSCWKPESIWIKTSCAFSLL